MLCAHRSGERAYELVERDDGYLGVPATDVGHYFAPYEEWSPIEQKAMTHASGRTLDVGCGAGRIGTYLQEQGHEVVGIDLSERAVEICRERGLTARMIDIAELNPRRV